jgi:hypothetical protein
VSQGCPRATRSPGIYPDHPGELFGGRDIFPCASGGEVSERARADWAEAGTSTEGYFSR